MTGSTATSDDTGPFDTTFGIASTVLAVVLLLAGLFLFWTGYQGTELAVVGTEMDLLTGLVGLLFGMFFAGAAAIAALYMEPGFDH